MNCPVCSTELRVVERLNIEVDVCPRCKGVWLDRGELDKIIDRAEQDVRRHRRDAEEFRDDYRGEERREDRQEDRRDNRREEPPPPRKKESFWSNLFDWD